MLLIGFIVSIVFVVGGFILCLSLDEEWGLIPAILGLIAAVVFGALGLAWHVSAKQAERINAQYDTSYTAADLFYTEDLVRLELASKLSIENVNSIRD